MDATPQQLREQIAQRDEMIAMMKAKTKEFITKLKSDHEEAMAKVSLYFSYFKRLEQQGLTIISNPVCFLFVRADERNARGRHAAFDPISPGI